MLEKGPAARADAPTQKLPAAANEKGIVSAHEEHIAEKADDALRDAERAGGAAVLDFLPQVDHSDACLLLKIISEPGCAMTHRWRTGGVGRDRPATCDFRPCTGGDVGRSVGCKQWAARRTPGSRECSAAARTEPSAEAGGQHAGEHVVLATCTRSDNFLAASQKQLGMLKRRQKKAATNAIAVGRETASLAEGLDVVRMAHDIPAPEPIHRGIVEGKLDGGALN